MENKLCFTCTCLRSYETIQSFKPLFKEGFGGVEIFYPYNVTDEVKETYTKAITELLKDEDVVRVMHLPYGHNSDLSIDDEEAASVIVKRYLDAIDYGKRFGVVRYTLHLGFRSTGNINKLIERVRLLCDFAYPGCIMIENMPHEVEFGASNDELTYLFKTINKSNLRFIYDTGHGHVENKNTALEKKMLDDHQNILLHFHINDNDSTKDQHICVGKGNIEFEKVLADLVNYNYQGLFCLEILYNTADDLREYAKAFTKVLKNVGFYK